MKPPFTYFGGKTAIAAQIARLLPAHEHYVEPFAGSLAVLLAKRPSPMETVNDLSGDLMAFWRALRDRPGDLERACALTPHGRAEHEGAYAPATDDVERARRVWVMLTQGRGGHLGRRSGWRFYADPQGSHSYSMPEYLNAYLGRFAAAAGRLHAVSLECRPALEVIACYGKHPDVLIYADPPYPRNVRTWTNGRGYGCEMASEDDHRELAEALRTVKSAVFLSGYASELYDELYTSWRRMEIAANAGNGVSGTRQRTEVIWSNRPFPFEQPDLFEVTAS